MKLFISYSRDDKEWTYKLWRALRDKSRYDTWIDLDIKGASDWWECILDEIESAECIIFVMTPESIESIYCRTEINYAIALNKPILPLMLKMCSYPTELSRIQYQTITDQMGLSDTLLEIANNIIQIERDRHSGKYVPKPASRPTLPKPTVNATETMKIAEDAAEKHNYSLAESLLQQVIDSDKGILGETAQERLQEIRMEREYGAEYQKVRRLADSPTMFQKAWQKFHAKYPDYDPDNLALRFAEKSENEPSFKDFPGSKILQPHTLPLTTFFPQPFAWCDIPTGQVTLENVGDVPGGSKVFDVQQFSIAKYPITNAQFQVFADAADGYKESKWWGYSEDAKAWRQQHRLKPTAFEGDNHPRTNVTWYEAVAFCQWLSAKYSLTFNLPTEQQWQFAAQGDDGREYPWGDGFDKTRCNTKESGIGKTTPVTQYPSGKSPFDVMDMSGNVLEWCLSSGIKNYQFPSDIYGSDKSVLRGGSIAHDQSRAFVSFRLPFNADHRDYDVGFRVAYIP